MRVLATALLSTGLRGGCAFYSILEALNSLSRGI